MSDQSGMVQAALALLDSLDPGQLDATCFPLAEEGVRTDWAYIPRPRPGLALGRLRSDQHLRLQELLAQASSVAGQAQVNAIIALEFALARLQPWFPDRDPSLYYLCLFGEPGDPAWAFRFEGHHVSLNVALTPSDLRATPAFLGANPAAVGGPSGPVSRPLGPEEDTARALLDRLGPQGRSRAIVSDTAPPDLLDSNAPMIRAREPSGIPAADLGPDARSALASLLAANAERLPPELAARELDRLEGPDGRDLWFAWAGSPEPGQGWYYRISGPRLWIEADSTQDAANHIHSVWRDPDGDFGRDLLGEHLARDHGVGVGNATADASNVGSQDGTAG